MKACRDGFSRVLLKEYKANLFKEQRNGMGGKRVFTRSEYGVLFAIFALK